MITHEDSYDFTFGKPTLTVSATFSIAVIGAQTQVFTQFNIQILVKLINNTENLCNFVFGNHRLVVL